MQGLLVDVRGQKWNRISRLFQHVADRAAKESVYLQICVNMEMLSETRKLAIHMNIDDNVEIVSEPLPLDRPVAGLDGLLARFQSPSAQLRPSSSH